MDDVAPGLITTNGSADETINVEALDLKLPRGTIDKDGFKAGLGRIYRIAAVSKLSLRGG
ncbi:hypothetical protein [Altererythrobacter sp. Root672]|uniref:hypothetical protein n=1 Tax=Altererythrobacter sp. Root672 TaxID=1736584 RepID=UPI0012E3DEB8|nr:hypothetical protein [Altererythrobacter sp. Root672]